MTDAAKQYPHTIQVDAAYGGRTFNDEDDIKTGHWETGLWCGCFKHLVPNCCMVTFCPCVTHAQISTRLGTAPYSVVLIAMFLLILLTCGAAHVVLFLWVWYLRALTRERFQIPGGCIRDCCASLFCPCCTLAQVATHIQSYKPGSCDFGPPNMLPPYSRT